MVKQFYVGGYDVNFSYLVVSGNKALIVDPCGDLSEVFRYIENENLEIIGILITHSHLDHIEGIPEVQAKQEVPVYIHHNGISRVDGTGIGEGDTLTVGEIDINVLHTPGHLDDSVCYYIEDVDGAPALITGDTLFVEGCGRANRTDAKDLYESLQRLKVLPENTNVYTGHDYGSIPISTMLHEKEHNRFLLAPDYESFLKERFPE